MSTQAVAATRGTVPSKEEWLADPKSSALIACRDANNRQDIDNRVDSLKSIKAEIESEIATPIEALKQIEESISYIWLMNQNNGG